MGSYSFGVPVEAVWSIHIIVGLYFMYLGYKLSKDNLKEISEVESRVHSLVLFGLGILMLSYHSHLWFLHTKNSKK